MENEEFEDHPLLQALGLRNKERKSEHIAFLDKEEVQKYNEMVAALKEARNMTQRAEALKAQFWSGIELHYNVFDKTLQIDEKTTALVSLT